MTREEIDFSIDRLKQLKAEGHWRALWSTFNESVQLMVSGEVVIQSMWSPAVTAVREQGVPCIYQDLKEGYRSWTLGHLLPRHVEGKKLRLQGVIAHRRPRRGFRRRVYRRNAGSGERGHAAPRLLMVALSILWESGRAMRGAPMPRIARARRLTRR